MRTSRMQAQPPKKKRSFTGLIVAVIVLGFAAYFISAGAAGNWLAENVFKPVFNSSDANAENVPETTETAGPENTISATVISKTSSGQIEENITADKQSLYTLQVGAFSDNSNAQQAANEVALKGGAGYIAYDGELYRVLIAGYTEKDDALNVKENLEKTSIESSLFVLESGTLEFLITAEPSQISAIKDCFEVVPSTTQALQQIIYDYDNGKDVKADLEDLKIGVAAAKENLEQSVNITEGALKSIHTFIEDFSGILNGLNTTDVDFSSKLKYNLISIVVRYSSLLEELNS